MFVLPGIYEAGKAKNYHPQITDKEIGAQKGLWRKRMVDI